MHKGFCRIVPLDRYNWELTLNIKLSPVQEEHTPSVLYSLAQANFEKLHPYGILFDDEMVGFIMYGEFAGICWINRIMVDEKHQRKGIGRAALRQLLELLKKKIRCKEIRTSFSVRNISARLFFESMGFQVLDEPVGGELIATFDQAKVW